MQRAPMFLAQIAFVCTVYWLLDLAKCDKGTKNEAFASYEEKARSELFTYDADLLDFDQLDDTVFITVFVRNKEHSLPYFFKALEDLDYDKNRIFLWIVCDHTRDNSIELIEKWTEAMQDQYFSIEFEKPKSPWHYPKQTSDLHWVKERHLRLLELRQTALIKAREQWADFILYIDADNILMNPYALRHLIDKDKVIVAPMLESTTAYSNFWGGMNERGYYVRTDDYFPIKKREKVGTFQVPMVHSTFLIDLTKSKSREVQFLPIRSDYKFDFDDIIVFASHCKSLGIPMHVDNSAVYGYLPPPLSPEKTLEDEQQSFIHLRMEVMTEPPVAIGIEMKKSDHVQVPAVNPSKLGLDDIFMINLKRRSDRRIRMKKVLQMLGIDFTWYKAVDSSDLNTTYLREAGIDMLPGYVDPFRERPLTRGEIGCFLSHFNIWNKMIEENYEKILILEDDVRFEPNFVPKLTEILENIRIADMPWDLIYVGRKRQSTEPEPNVEGVEGLVLPEYSYWTIGYLLSRSGAEKLVDGDPLGHMVPVDEYLPIMYDRHPISLYKDQFPKRDLIALSVKPLLIYPTHYTNDINYFSDTETSSIWEEVSEKAGTHEMLDKLRSSDKTSKSDDNNKDEL